MANEILEALTRANIVASVAILLVLVLRDPVRRWFGARIAYALWMIVPCAAAAGFLPARSVTGVAIAPPSVIPVLLPDMTAPLQRAQEMWGAGMDSARALQLPDFASLFIALWIAGLVISAGLLMARQIRFRRALGLLRPARVEKNAYLSESTSHGPLVAGVLTPKIILPADFAAKFNDEESLLVLAHEQVHVKRGDMQINLLVAIFQCLNWFNPLIHIAAFQIRLDQEIACDAEVVAIYPEKRRSYAEAMLKNMLSPTVVPVGCSWPSRSVPSLTKRIALLKRVPPIKAIKRAGIGIVAIASLAGAYVSWAAQPPEVTTQVAGRWAGESKNVSGGMTLYVLDLKVEGKKLAGTFTAARPPVLIQDGTISGSKISYLTIGSTGQYGMQTLKNSGEVKGDELTIVREIVGAPAGSGTPPPLVLKRVSAEAAGPANVPAPEVLEDKARKLADQQRPRVEVPLDPKEFDKLVGFYQMGWGGIFTITRQGDRFLGRLTGQEAAQMYPEAPTKFFAKFGPAQLTFNLDGQGKAVSLVLHQDGKEQVGLRVDESVAKAAEGR